MHHRRKHRLLIISGMAAGIAAAVGFTLAALNQNINLFYSPTQIIEGEAPSLRPIRVGGMVVTGSVARSGEALDVQFDLTDTLHTVSVSYNGILPDLFREGQGIVALGKMNNGVFLAEEVLAKHDETYMSPEVSEALQAAQARSANADTVPEQ